MIQIGSKVSFNAPLTVAEQISQLYKLPNVSDVSLNESLVTIRFIQENGSLESVLSFLKAEKIEYTHINSEMPTLNDVFLEITGKELRD
jgi:ABC-2 type transport system ATP-binding protein